MPLTCADCGRLIPASENKFKFPGEIHAVYVCNDCGNKRIAELAKQEKASE
ncbi:MAG: hypothetical protein R3185_01790 [Candidatus Thermoplasmatota archaeon]|nr:hypothetical protein [Candidatus Thermoplasmatota archaeon]